MAAGGELSDGDDQIPLSMWVQHKLYASADRHTSDVIADSHVICGQPLQPICRSQQ